MRGLADCLGISSVDLDEVVTQLELLSYDSPGEKNDQYNYVTQYHRGHVTDGRSGSWRGMLDPQLVEEIEEKYGHWLEDRGYPLTCG